MFNLEDTGSAEAEKIDGDIAQLGERLPCKQEVAGSIPTISTIPQKHTLLREPWKTKILGQSEFALRQGFANAKRLYAALAAKPKGIIRARSSAG